MSALRGPGDWYWLPVTSFVPPSLMGVKDVRLWCVLERYLRGRVGEKVVVKCNALHLTPQPEI